LTRARSAPTITGTEDFVRHGVLAASVAFGFGVLGLPAPVLAQSDFYEQEPPPPTVPDVVLPTAADTDAPEAAQAPAGELVVTVNVPGAAVSIDGAPAGTSPLPGPLSLVAGPHVVEASCDGFDHARVEVAVTAGRRAAADLTLMPAPSLGRTARPGPVAGPPAVPSPDGTTSSAAAAPSGPQAPNAAAGPADEDRGLSQGWFFAAAGLTLALGVGGAVVGGMVQGLEDEYDAALASCRGGNRFACGDGPRIVADHEDYQLAANTLLFSAAGFAVAAVVLAFFTDFGIADDDPDAAAAAPVPTLTPAPGGTGFALTLAF
jgi:hypothetical protein